MLRIEGMQKSYGKLRVLEGVDLHVAPGEVCGLICQTCLPSCSRALTRGAWMTIPLAWNCRMRVSW
jgi:ABC-type histidine transport system ATPase subunit